jgi:hypothetical protein
VTPALRRRLRRTPCEPIRVHVACRLGNGIPLTKRLGFRKGFKCLPSHFGSMELDRLQHCRDLGIGKLPRGAVEPHAHHVAEAPFVDDQVRLALDAVLGEERLKALGSRLKRGGNGPCAKYSTSATESREARATLTPAHYNRQHGSQKTHETQASFAAAYRRQRALSR